MHTFFFMLLVYLYIDSANNPPPNNNPQRENDSKTKSQTIVNNKEHFLLSINKYLNTSVDPAHHQAHNGVNLKYILTH